MQELKLANDLFISLFEGTKRATVRRGSRDIIKGAMALEAADGGGWGVIVNVTEVRHKKLSELTDEEAKADCAESAGELTTDLKRFYPDITSNSDITIVFFDFKDPLDIPECVFLGCDDDE